MFIRFFANDNSPQGRLDISESLKAGFTLRLFNQNTRSFDREAEQILHRIVNRALAHEATLVEEERLSLVEILKLIATEAVQPPDELADGSTDFHVTQARIDEARAAIAALEAP
jgi:hypothetical protein